MHLVFSPGVFALGVAVGVLGLVLLLSLIVAYAYDERTLLGLAAYLSLMVAATLAGQRLQVNDELVQNLLLVAGPALMSAALMRLLKNRQASPASRVLLGIVLLATLGLLGLCSGFGPVALVRNAALAWVALLLAFCLMLTVQSWDTTGPWKWWFLIGHLAGLAAALCFLADIA
ncbi:MAG: hypothetical protein ABIP46_06910, partial [Polaromonas sp.]